MDQCITYHNHAWYPRVNRPSSDLCMPISRLICAITYGLPVHGDWLARHTCDNARCIRVDHIVPGTEQDNIDDRVARGRSAVGLSNGRAKLSDADIADIRTSNATAHEMADKYNVTPDHIWRVRKGTRR